MAKRALEADIDITNNNNNNYIVSWIGEQMPELCMVVYTQGLLLGIDPDLDQGLWNLAQTTKNWHAAFTSKAAQLIMKQHMGNVCHRAVHQSASSFGIGRCYPPLFRHALVFLLTPADRSKQQDSVLKLCGPKPTCNSYGHRVVVTAYARYCQNLDSYQQVALDRHLMPRVPVARQSSIQYRPNFTDTPMHRAYWRVLCRIGALAHASVTYAGPIAWERWLTNTTWLDMYTTWRTRLPESTDELIVFALAFASHAIRHHYGSYEFQLLVHFLITHLVSPPDANDVLWTFRAQHQEVRGLYQLWAVNKKPLLIPRLGLMCHNPFNDIK